MTTRIIYFHQRYRVQKRFFNINFYLLFGLLQKYSWQTFYSSKNLDECISYQDKMHFDYDLEIKKINSFQPIIKTS